MRTFSNLRKQRGISLGSLILILIILGVIGMLAIQIVPAVIEYQSIKKAIVDARNRSHSVQEIKDTYNKIAISGYITALSAKDLNIVKEGDNYVVSCAYEKKLHLVGPASLVLDFESSTDKN